MKYFLYIVTVALIITNSFASDELQRIDSLVQEITTLRENYEKQLQQEKEQTRLAQEKIHYLENQIKKMDLAVKTEEKDSTYFKASAFRLCKDADIYADANSMKVVDQWENGTSFTSNIKNKNRIKITGYFVDGIWQKAQKNMWINRESVKQRD